MLSCMRTFRRLFPQPSLDCALDSAQCKAPFLEVTGAAKQPLRLNAADFAALPHASAGTKNDGIAVTYYGVRLHEMFKKAGAPVGAQLHDKALASFRVAEAQDGYQVVFSPAELDPLFIDNPVLLADSADGNPLGGAQGLFRLVASEEKRGARSIRMLTKLQAGLLRK